MTSAEELELWTVKTVLAALFTVFLMPAASASGIDTISADGTTSAYPGDSVTISMLVVNMDNVGSIQLDLSYDLSVISASSVEQGSATSGASASFSSNIDTSAGKATVGIISTSALSGSGSIADITFSVIGVGGNTSPLNIRVIVITDPVNAPVGTWPDVTNSTFYVDTATTMMGGGGGGGGGGGMPPATGVMTSSERVEITIPSISPGVMAMVEIPDIGDVYLTGLSINTGREVVNVKVIVSTLRSKPEEVGDVPGEVYHYSTIEIQNIDDEDISNVTIRFKVEQSWIRDRNIDPDTVSMNRYSNGIWNELPTTRTGSDSDYIYYSAISPGFSNFAISGEKIAGAVEAAVPQITLAAPLAIPTTTLALAVPVLQVPIPASSTHFSQMWGALILVAVIAVGGYIFVRKGNA